MRINKMLTAALCGTFLWANSVSVIADDINLFKENSNAGDWKQLSNQAPERRALLRSIQGSGLFTNITQISLDGINTSFSGNLMTLHNVRIASSTTSLNDYISIDFLLDAASLRLVPVSTEIVPNLGIYYREEKFFSKDVPADIFLVTPDGNRLAPDQLHNITATSADKFTMELVTGTAFTLKLFNPSDDYQIQITAPDGSNFSRGLYRKNSKWTMGPFSVLETGIYTFQFLPENNTSVSLQFSFWNNNNTTVRDLISGSSISVFLNENSYAKYRIKLGKGDLLSVSDPSDNDVYLNLLNSNGSRVSSGNGELFTRIAKAGDYYLFVQNTDYANSASYSGRATITPDPDIANYPTLNPIAAQSVETGQAYTLQTQATAANKYTATGLPPTLSINESTGLISGTPLVSGKFPVKVNVKNDFGSDEQFFLLTISGNETTAEPSTGTVSIKEDLSIHMPYAIYQSSFGNLILWADLVFVPQADGRLMWELSNFGELK